MCGVEQTDGSWILGGGGGGSSNDEDNNKEAPADNGNGNGNGDDTPAAPKPQPTQYTQASQSSHHNNNNGKRTNFVFPSKVVLVLGSEREGIPAALLGDMDACLEIPQVVSLTISFESDTRERKRKRARKKKKKKKLIHLRFRAKPKVSTCRPRRVSCCTNMQGRDPYRCALSRSFCGIARMLESRECEYALAPATVICG